MLEALQRWIQRALLDQHLLLRDLLDAERNAVAVQRIAGARSDQHC
jgi:hypothetical protein